MRDPYLILGLSRNASADEIKSAYRKLAKKYHPDVNQGKRDVEQKFKEITAAHDILSDVEKRKKFDRGEIDADGNERGFAGGDSFGGARGGAHGYSRRGSGMGGDPFAQYADMDDIFSEFMGGGRGGKRQASPASSNVTYTLTIPFVDSCLGGKRRVSLANGKTIDVTIPAGVNDGHKLRLKGQGEVGFGRVVGDAIVEIKIEPHVDFVRKDNDIYQEIAISIPEALLGSSIEVPTLNSSVILKVPAGANSGTILRMKGKGVPTGKATAGDMLVKLKLMLPEKITTDLVEFFEIWNKKNAYNPRKK